MGLSAPGLKVLLVAARYPWPPRRGDQIRAVQAISALAEENEVTLLAPRPAAGEPQPPAVPCRVEIYEPGGPLAVPLGLARAGLQGWPFQTALFVSADLRKKIRELRPRAEVGILPLARLAPYAADFGDLPLVVDLIDSLALNFERRAAVDRPWLRPCLLWEAARLERAERRLIGVSRRTLVVCERDRADLARRVGPEAAGKLGVVGIAVPLEISEKSASRAEAAPPALALTGNLGYFVNSDAALWFLARVWPELRRRRPDLRLRLIGDRPGGEVRRAARAPGVELIASPPDLRALLRASTIALAPMRCGSGVPIKILEAWALGVPVVASAWAAAGTPGRHGVDLEVAGERPDDWVEALLRLLDDPEARARLAEGGRRTLAERFSPEAVHSAWRQGVRGAV